jgi:hypothetical protein
MVLQDVNQKIYSVNGNQRDRSVGGRMFVNYKEAVQ